MSKKAIIVGAGPAGLTAAYELLERTDIIPIIIEKSGYIGGISRTINYKGNRMDMGPHRFFSKSDRVMDWWLKMMPLAEKTDQPVEISYQNKKRVIEDPCSYEKEGTWEKGKMLVIPRLTRIYFLRKFFAYPIIAGDPEKSGPGKNHQHIAVFYEVKTFPEEGGEEFGGFSNQPVWKDLIPIIFQGLYRKSLGASL